MQLSLFDTIPPAQPMTTKTTPTHPIEPIVDQKKLRAYKKKYNFFETSPQIAKKMATLLKGISRNTKVLDPEAGLGALTSATQKECNFPLQIDCCEIQEDFHKYLSDFNLVGTDFINYRPGPIYSAAIMNPPYRRQQAQQHIEHAWNCLLPGGRIVALVNKTTADYVDEEFMGYVFHKERIEKGFTETNIDTYIFLIHKPLFN